MVGVERGERQVRQRSVTLKTSTLRSLGFDVILGRRQHSLRSPLHCSRKSRVSLQGPHNILRTKNRDERGTGKLFDKRFARTKISLRNEISWTPIFEFVTPIFLLFRFVTR